MPAPEMNGHPAPDGSASVMPTLFGVGYGTYQVRRETFVVSFLLHILAAGLIVASSSFVYNHREEIKQQVTGIVTDISPYVLPPSSTKAGGGVAAATATSWRRARALCPNSHVNRSRPRRQ